MTKKGEEKKNLTPLFNDLGKKARDIFWKGYNIGLLKVETKSRHCENLELKLHCAHATAAGRFFGGFDLNYRIPQRGVTLSERWNTDNVFSAEVTLEDGCAKNLRTVLGTYYAPYVGTYGGKLRGEYRHNMASVSAEVKSDGVGPLLNGAFVLGLKGICAGFSSGFDPSIKKFTHNHISAALEQDGFGLHAFLKELREFGGTYYHKVNKRIELAASMEWTKNEPNTRFSLGTCVKADEITTLKAKVDNRSTISLAVMHTLLPTLTVSISVALNMRKFNDGGHQFGFGVEYDATKKGKESTTPEDKKKDSTAIHGKDTADRKNTSKNGANNDVVKT